MRKYLSHPVEMTPTDWAVDAIVAAGAFGFACLQLTFANALLVPDELLRRLFGLVGPISPAMALGAVALTTLPLVLRRRFPWPVLGLTLMAWALFQPSVGAAALSLAGPLAALFTLACERSRGETLAAAGCVLAVLLLLPQALGALAPTRPGPGAPVKPQDVSALMLVQNVALTLVASFAGYALHVRQDYLRAAEERAEEAERTREATARRRVEEERLRIAREVHDITAHSLSAVSIQAAAAERLVEADPPAAKEAIGQVRAIAKDALDEMRAIVGVLRSGGDRMPTQGTDRLGDLAAYLADAGVEAVVDASAYQRAVVPAYIDVALFSMACEAVTNVVRHAGASRSWVRLATAEAPGGGLEARLSVEDDGCGIAPAAMSAGHGLEGLAERAALLGGTLAVGPRAAAAEGAQGLGGEGGAVAGDGGWGAGTGPATLAGSAGGAGGAGSTVVAEGASDAAGAPAGMRGRGEALMGALPEGGPITLLVADDQEVVRSGYTALLNTYPDLQVVGGAADGVQAVELACQLKPDVVLMDIRMPRKNGIEATRDITANPLLARTHVLVLTTFDLDEYAYDALAAGGGGFMLKDAEPDDIAAAIRVVARGDTLIEPRVLTRLVETFVAARPRAVGAAGSLGPEALKGLTDREREILLLVARGLSNDQIGEELFISPATVKTHLARIMAKADAHDRAQLVILAYETGLVPR